MTDNKKLFADLRDHQDPQCPATPDLSENEIQALDWLMRASQAIGENPKSCNRLKGGLAAIALEKLIIHSCMTHDVIHKLEAIAFESGKKLIDAHRKLEENEIFNSMASFSSTEGKN